MTNAESDALHWDEYKKYVQENKTSKYERKLLRDWVRSGHSVYETVESRYLTGPSEPPMDYLDAYRLDKELKDAMKGMTITERTSYLKAWMGWDDPSPDQTSSDIGFLPEV